MKIIRADFVHLENLASLFNKYRIFYKQPSDLEIAKEFMQERLRNLDSVLFLAWDAENKIGAGFVQLYPTFSSIHAKRIFILNDLFVEQEYRGKGISKLLMQKAKEHAIENHTPYMLLSTATDNTVAQSLYKQCGYKPNEKFVQFFLDLTY